MDLDQNLLSDIPRLLRAIIRSLDKVVDEHPFCQWP